MAIEHRKATSEEMKGALQAVQKMAGRMGFDENMEKVNWKLVRLLSNLGYTFMPKAEGVKFKNIRLGRVKAVLATPQELRSEDIILHIHGGGAVSGSAKASKGYCSMLAKESGLRVISVDYRLAPEHPYPAGLDDCYAAYQEVRASYPQSDIALIGESAGAHFCHALLVRCINRNEALPASISLNSPFIMLETGRDLSFGVTDVLVQESCIGPLQRIYARGADCKNTELSPLYDTNEAQYPPVFITCDAHETLRADSEILHDKCEKAGVNVKLIELEGSFHSFATTGTGVPETKQILQENCRFILDSFKEAKTREEVKHG